ncbi:MAG: 2-C-methyl-D-erythritol 4-phosphate cytidylyltransferase [Pseudomonadota bacterium]
MNKLKIKLMQNKQVQKSNAIILASGKGERFGTDLPKQFIEIQGKTVIELSIEAFERNENIDNIILVANPDFRLLIEEIISKNSYKKVSKILDGGLSRQESSFIGVNAIQNDDDLILIHDAVRPFVADELINDVLEALKSHDAVSCACASSDTIYRVNDKMEIVEIPARNLILQAQTPQGFKASLIKKAHQMAKQDQNINVTDDVSLVFNYNLASVYVVKGLSANIKITHKEDLNLSASYLQS